MNTFTLRLPQDTKEKLEKTAKTRGKSVSQVIQDYLDVGFMLDKYTKNDSEVIVSNPAGTSDPDKDVILPVRDLMGKKEWPMRKKETELL